jgi:hypothetical protein
LNVFPASGLRHRMSAGLLVGLLMACQVACAGYEGPPAPIPSASPAVIRTQAAQYAPSVLPAAPESTPTFKGVTALMVAPQDVPPVNELEQWVQTLMQDGITMVLLDIGTNAGSNRLASNDGQRAIGIYFRSQWAETIRDIFGELVPLAHQQGLLVFASVSPRRINWVDPTVAWLDRSYDPVHHQLRVSPSLDLFHPAFQEYLVGLLSDLADTGVDGILFRNDVSLGPYDGFSAFGVRAFERDFHTRMEPAQLFTRAKSTGQGASSDGQSLPAEFWHWAGWKARERVKILERLSRAMRSRANTRHVALEVHPEAVTDPRAALVRYGEDLLEAKRRFQYFLVRPFEHAAISEVHASQRSMVLEQMKGLLGASDRIWTAIPISSEGLVGVGRSSQADRAELGKDIGLIYQRN